MIISRLFSTTPNFDFIKIKNLSYFVSILLICCSILCITTKSFNFGVDFLGGINIELRTEKKLDLGETRKLLNDLDLGEVTLQNFGSEYDISIKVPSQSENIDAVVNLLKETLESSVKSKIEYRKIDFVGPKVGSQMIESSIIAVTLAFMGVMLYIWYRFQWYFGIGMLLALIHDIIISLGFMSFLEYNFNLTTIAAILIVIGYSVNDSVVIYDRIRTNLRKYHNKSDRDIINLSINQTLSRTTITSISTILANIALIVYGGPNIRDFSILVLCGFTIGTYSSINIAAPILMLFRFKEK